jgi:formyl-CoA transferase
VGIPVADLSAGLYLAQGILVALLEREVSGQGQWVKTSLLQAMIAMMDFQASRWLLDQEVPPQAGNDHPTSIPTGVFKTSGGHINIAASGDHMWERLCYALELDHLVNDPRFLTGKDRSRNRAAVNAALGEKLREHPSEHWVKTLNEVGVPCGPIYAMNEVFADPQVQHLGMAAPVRHPELGQQHLVNQPVSLSRTPGGVRFSSPDKGQDTDAVLGEFGYSSSEITELRKAGAI